jgi:hypothetical protein
VAEPRFVLVTFSVTVEPDAAVAAGGSTAMSARQTPRSILRAAPASTRR